MEDRSYSPYPCSAHPEFVQATARLMTAVDVLSNNVRWIVNIGKGVFGIGVALIVTIIVSIYSAGKLSSRIDTLEHNMKVMQEYIREHELDRNAHHD